MRWCLALAVACLLATGCTTTRIGVSTPPGTIAVVATTTQMQDLVREVGGSHVVVVGILEPNVDPHEFDPTPRDAIALSGAMLVVVSGVGIDTWAQKLIANAGSGAPEFDASAGLPIRHGDADLSHPRPAMQRRMLTDRGCDPVLEIDTDHWPWLSRTDEFVGAMNEIIDAVG